MTTVVDHKGAEIKVGTRVLYGAPAPGEERADYLATVTVVSDPDIDDRDEEERTPRQLVVVTIKFDKAGDEEQIRAYLRQVRDWFDEDGTFEAHDDIEVVA